MKLIIAYVQPERMGEVKRALQRSGIHRMSVTNALGCGAQGGFQESYRGAEVEVNLLKKVRFEIAVNDAFVEPAIEAIIEGARTEHIGDGKIFIMPMEECVRIRTGERGGEAIG